MYFLNIPRSILLHGYRCECYLSGAPSGGMFWLGEGSATLVMGKSVFCFFSGATGRVRTWGQR